MGVFNWPIRLDSLDGERSLEIEAMVDTGASYTIMPAGLLKELGVAPIDKISLVLADGRPVEYDIRRGYVPPSTGALRRFLIAGCLWRTITPALCLEHTPWRGCAWRWTRPMAG